MSALSIQGVSSSAGKSLVVTALARAFHRRGVRVAPFKAQNMSNNARVVDGGEIGVAQYLQARAAGIEPDVRMNPILVKPEGDDRSQLVVLGKVDHVLSRRPWRERPPTLWPVAKRALGELLSEYELVVLEGAGSPAETNLRTTDLSNMRSAHEARAPVVLVADIDRGGAFAHLQGTWSLVTPEDRELIHGFVLNRFRGDESLLAPAPADLERATGMRYVGLLPFVAHGLPDEDGAATPDPTPTGRRVGIVRYPNASNLDEFKLLEQVADVSWIGASDSLAPFDLIVLPGSKQVAADLDWLRRSGRAAEVVAHATAGRPVLGICGGLQMLGEQISDPVGVDGTRSGLGLLPLDTVFGLEKRTENVELEFGSIEGPFAALAGRRVRSYEIRHGETTPVTDCCVAPADRAFALGSVLGVTAHGVLSDSSVLAALFGQRPSRDLERVFDELADLVEERFDVAALGRLAGLDTLSLTGRARSVPRMNRSRLGVVAVIVGLAGVSLASAVGAGAAPRSKLTFDDRIAPHATTSVTVVVRRAAAFSVRFRVSPTSGRTRVTLTGAKAPKGGPLLDTKGVGCNGAAGSWVCEGSFEALPPGTYTFKVRRDAPVAGRFELDVSW